MSVVQGKTFTLKGLAPGGTYVIEVQSVPKKGKPSKWSRPIKFNTNSKGSPPPNITNLAADFKGNTLVVTWDGSAARAEKDFKHFRIRVTSPDHPGVTKNYFTDSNVFKFQEDQNRDAFGSYEGNLSITVYSLDRTGNQSSGVSISASSEPPVAPTNVKLSAAVLGYNVTWDLPTFPNYKETRIYHSTTQNGTYTLALTAYGSGGFVSLASLTERWVKVAHVNLADVESEKVASTPPNIIPIDPVPTDVTPPAVPVSLNFEPVGTEDINGITTATMRAHWEVSEITSGYKVRVTEDTVTKSNWSVYDVPATKATVTSKQISSNVATLTLSSHSFAVDDYITVFDVGAPFNGKHKITSVVPNVSISFNLTNSNISLTTSSGSVVLSSYTIKELYPGTAYIGSILAYDSANNITQFVAEGPFTTPGTPAIIGSPIKIDGTTMAFGPNVSGTNDGLFINSNNYWYNTGYFNAGTTNNSIQWDGVRLRVDGSVSARGGSFSGNVFLAGQNLENDTTASLIAAPYYEIQSGSYSSGVGTITLSSTPSPAWSPGDTIVISQASPAFDHNFAISTISGPTITFTMSTNSISVPPISSGKVARVNTGDRVVFNSYGIQGWEDGNVIFSLNRSGTSKIGGWTIKPSKIFAGSGANSVGFNSSSGSNVRIYAGAEDPDLAPFKVFKSGNIRAYGLFSSSDIDSGTRISIGADVSGSKDGVVLDDASEPGNQNFWYVPSTVTNGNKFFQVGTLDGSAISVKKDSTTGLPKVEIKDYNIVGVSKIIDQSSISIIGASEAIDLIKIGKNVDPRTGFGGRDGISINANNFWTLSNDGSNVNFRVGDTSSNYLFWNGSSLTISGQINVLPGGNAATTSQLSLKADNSGSAILSLLQDSATGGMTGVQLNSSGYIRSLNKTYGSSTAGWILEHNGGTPRFDIGNSSKYLRWDGSQLLMNGKVLDGSTIGTDDIIANSSEGILIDNALAITSSRNGGSIIFYDPLKTGDDREKGGVFDSMTHKYSNLEGGRGIGFGSTGYYPFIEAGYDSVTGTGSPRIRIKCANVTLPGTFTPTSGVTYGPSLLMNAAAFGLTGGDTSYINGMSDSTSPQRLLGKNANGHLRWAPGFRVVSSVPSSGSVSEGEIIMVI